MFRHNNWWLSKEAFSKYILFQQNASYSYEYLKHEILRPTVTCFGTMLLRYSLNKLYVMLAMWHSYTIIFMCKFKFDTMFTRSWNLSLYILLLHDIGLIKICSE